MFHYFSIFHLECNGCFFQGVEFLAGSEITGCPDGFAVGDHTNWPTEQDWSKTDLNWKRRDLKIYWGVAAMWGPKILVCRDWGGNWPQHIKRLALRWGPSPPVLLSRIGGFGLNGMGSNCCWVWLFSPPSPSSAQCTTPLHSCTAIRCDRWAGGGFPPGRGAPAPSLARPKYRGLELELANQIATRQKSSGRSFSAHQIESVADPPSPVAD